MSATLRHPPKRGGTIASVQRRLRNIKDAKLRLSPAQKTKLKNYILAERKPVSGKPQFVADPERLPQPLLTQEVSQARQFNTPEAANKHLGRHPKLKKRFRQTRIDALTA